MRKKGKHYSREGNTMTQGLFNQFFKSALQYQLILFNGLDSSAQFFNLSLQSGTTILE